MSDLLSSLASDPNDPNRSLTLIISCADPRVVPESIFGLSVGEAVVMRNAGGDVQKALPDILAVDQLLRLSDVVIVRHTGKYFILGQATWAFSLPEMSFISINLSRSDSC